MHRVMLYYSHRKGRKTLQTRKGKTMTKSMRIEYGTFKTTTMVYIVNEENRDVIAMPVLFPQNRAIMTNAAWKLAVKK